MNVSRTQHWLKFFRYHFQGGFVALCRRFIWEMPQTILGFWVGSFAIMRFRNAREVSRWGNSIVVRGYKHRKYWGGVCFGTVILGDSRIAAVVNNPLFMHEYGHCLQSQAKGPIYLGRYGLPSLISARGKGVHNCHPVEQDANLRAEAFFSKVNGFERWPSEINPIQNGSALLKPYLWEYLPGPSPLFHIAMATRQWWQARKR